RVPAATYIPTVVNNTSCLKLGSADCFVEDTHTTLVTGTASIVGTVWRDDAAGGGILGNGIQDGAETGIGDGADPDATGVTVNLYWDANGDGDHTDAGDFLYTTTTSDASGNYSFTDLPATSGSARYLIEVNVLDSDIPQGYGPTTATSYTGISLASGAIYGDDPTEPSDFGFAPALDVEKRVDTVGTIMVGDTIQYTIAVSNTLPGSGASSAMCEYSVWAGSESTVGNPTTGSGNSAWQNVPYAIGRPDSRFSTTIMSNSTDIIGLTGFNMGPQVGVITSVKYVVYMKEVVDFGDDEFIVRIFYNSAATPIRTDTYLNATLSSPIGTVYELEQDITSLRAWTWADFQNNLTEMQIEGNRIGGLSGDAGMDAAGFIITTDQPCGDAGSVLNPVPLTDTFDDNYFDFISANPPVSSSGTGTLTWNNVGPLYPGQTRYITVYMRAAQVGVSPATVNTATSTNSKFASGLPANSPEEDTASVTIVANTNTRTLSGTVFDDNSAPVNGWSGAAWTVGGAQTGMDAGDTGIQYIPVDLYGCVATATGSLVIGAGNGQSCAEENGEWRLIRTTSTDASGNYSFTALARGYYYAAVRSSLIAGPQTADVNQTAVCTTCDSRSNDPTSNSGLEDLEDATFVGNLDNAITAITRVNFGYNVPAGTYNIGDFFFYDWNGDGVQDASDEPVGGVTVRLLAADGSPLASTVTLADGSYLFTGRPSGYYTVQV
ncbi:MAG: SdrD B-like domain-containing protein, partial [Anaerolineales bacterium]